MSSRFVSAGQIGVPTGTAAEAAPAQAGHLQMTSSSTSAPAWAEVQAQLDAERRERLERRQQEQAGGGEQRSLYDVLQANKAAKQAAFEEAARLRNQFRALDDDEVEFLDEVAERRRREEEERRREEEEGVRGFRERQRREEGGAGGGEEGEEEWGFAAGGGRKRKREKEREKGIKGLKRRVSEVGEDDKTKPASGGSEEKAGTTSTAGKDADRKREAAPPAATKVPQNVVPESKKPKIGLVDYGSDDDSE
ncbi:hypothetical protein NKR23_g8539 [Pleurostoma richardsiae]|uniref:FAM192A/Fyv6 N-terminal domain-containing protein n=1 Tax=Pleurostoma richardsiae TaxID=41990 RepID=A0AA38R8T1_9PEZI|nr:hypothetical protein NKR23_g8539 [Pleurostoma richardsiae]